MWIAIEGIDGAGKSSLINNLEKKLQSLEEKDYLSMKALIFDHKTQIYVNDTARGSPSKQTSLSNNSDNISIEYFLPVSMTDSNTNKTISLKVWTDETIEFTNTPTIDNFSFYKGDLSICYF